MYALAGVIAENGRKADSDGRGDSLIRHTDFPRCPGVCLPMTHPFSAHKGWVWLLHHVQRINSMWGRVDTIFQGKLDLLE